MNRQRVGALGLAGVALAAAAVAIMVTRSSDGSAQPSAAPSSASASPVRVVLPGKPGESATVTDSDKVPNPPVSTWNTVDKTFVQMMIVHHEQALRMAELAPGRAANAQLRGLADRISVAQRGEIDILRSWLRQRSIAADDPGHDHSTMPGMQSETALAALAAAKNADFDRRFVTMMTEHHRGALQMAQTVLRGGEDQQLAELASEMAVEQTAEIDRMADLGLT